jgi:release factor glutamine methyltransferase
MKLGKEQPGFFFSRLMDKIPEFYPDSEDSYLLMDSLEADIHAITSRFRSGIVSVEIGPGGGLVSQSFVNLVLKHEISIFHLAIDVNKHAALETRSQIGNLSSTDVVLGDMFDGIRTEIQFDVIFCNPPYVPSSPINRARDIRASYAGGERGREFIDQFLPKVSERLAINGVFYLLLEKRNDIDEVLSVAKEQYHLEGTLILDRKIRGEHLFVYRFIRILR